MNINLQSQRHEAAKYWRAGLADARDVYREWEAGPRDKDAPNAVGDQWFEGHDRTYPAPVKRRYSAQLTKSIAITRLSCCCRLNGRIEADWVNEAKGHSRRARKRRQ